MVRNSERRLLIMKTYKTLILAILVSVVLYLGFEISQGKVSFGSAWWSDTLSNRITTNKAINLRPGDSLYYNGNVVTSGSGTSIDTNKYLSIYRLDTSNIGFLSQANTWTKTNQFPYVIVNDSLNTNGMRTLADIYLEDGISLVWNVSTAVSISGQINQLIYSANTHTYKTDYGNNLASLDSATGLTLTGDATINGYAQVGASAPKIAMKLVRGLIDTLGADTKMYHGLSDYRRIVAMNFILIRDTSGTTSKIFTLGYNGSTQLNIGNVLYSDTTHIRYYCPTNSTALNGDSIKVLITYEY